MERDPFSRINPESSPESRDKDSDDKKEKKGEKKRTSFMDELLERRNSKENADRGSGNEKKASFGDVFQKKELVDEASEKTPTKKELAKEFLDHKAEELRGEIKNHPSSDQTAEAQADLELVEAISEKIDDPDKEVEPAVEEAYNELMGAMAELDDADNPVETGEALEEYLEADAEALNGELMKTDDEDADDTATVTPPPTSSSSGTGGTPPPTSPTSSSSTPPIPPHRPVAPLQPASAAPLSPQPNFNTTPTTTPEVEADQRRRVAGKMIVAGAVGYMIGRRGGRKRTEAKLTPEITKRDETIVDLKKDIEAKEASIRLHARQESTTKTEPETIEKTTHETTPPTPAEIMSEEPTNEKDPVVTQASPEGEQTIQKTAEKPQADQYRVVHEHKVQLEKEHIKNHTETVSTPVLLQVAEKITVLDTTVKKLYDTNQIDRRGLEEIVKEHLAGHDIGPVLDRRLLGKEAILERAHEYRHDPDSDDAKAKIPKASAKTPSIEQPLDEHGSRPSIHDVKPFQPGAFNALTEPSAPEQAEEAQPAEIAHEQAQKALQKKYKTTNIAAMAVIAIVTALLAVRILFM